MSYAQYPLISIVIVTYNSERTLNSTLRSIQKQSYPKSKLEILIIDGGSTDGTIAIGKKYLCRLIVKPKTEVVYRKHIGLLRASGKYVVFIDSDESLESSYSLMNKYISLKENSFIKSVISSGFKSPYGAPFINDYLNDLGDPFSFYMYRESYGDKFLIHDKKKRFFSLKETEEYIIFSMKSKKETLIEPWAGGSMLDKEYIFSAFPLMKKNVSLLPLAFYLLKKRGKQLAITKNDAIIHNSSRSLYVYLKKLSSRIKNNIFETKMGRSGYLGREKFQGSFYFFKKFLFPVYSFSLILPLFDSIYLSASRKKMSYFIHLPLCLYTSVLIVYFAFIKILGIYPRIGRYGD